MLSAGEENILLTRIVDVDTEPGVRFRYDESEESVVEDPEGNCCIWKVEFEVVPMPMDARTYLMRWNPSISSFTEDDYEECLENMVHGMFRMNWSISEWEEARRGDTFKIKKQKTGLHRVPIFICGCEISYFLTTFLPLTITIPL